MSRPIVVIGRHEFTPRQKELLRKAGLNPENETKRIIQLNNPQEAVESAKAASAAIVVQALPLPLLAQLLQAAARAGVEVYGFRMETIASVPVNENCPESTEIERPAEGGVKRCVRTAALQRLKRIVIEAEDVAN